MTETWQHRSNLRRNRVVTITMPTQVELRLLLFDDRNLNKHGDEHTADRKTRRSPQIDAHVSAHGQANEHHNKRRGSMVCRLASRDVDLNRSRRYDRWRVGRASPCREASLARNPTRGVQAATFFSLAFFAAFARRP